MKLFIRMLFGYCWCCGRWFKYPKKRRMDTRYEKDEDNFCKVCSDCFEEVEEIWRQQWRDYYGM